MARQRAARAVLFGALVLTSGLISAAQQPAQTVQQPLFKSGVELIAVDVAIVDRNGNPIAGVRPEQFNVTIDGKPRRVVSAEFVEFVSRDTATAARPATVAVARPLFSSNQEPALAVSQGRLIYLAIDQASFQPFGARGAMEAARRFIDRLQPADRVGLVAFPAPGPSVAASRDHAAARAATAHIIGSATPFRIGGLDKNVSLAEAIDIRGGDQFTFERVVARECGTARSGSDRRTCEEDVRATAGNVGRNAEYQANRSISGIEAVINGLAQIRERKTLVLISAGLPVADRAGRDLQLISTVASIGREAAAANLNFYVLHMDSGFLDAFSASERTISDTLSRDLGIMSGGLETIAGASGGSLASVVAGADFAFDKVLRETAAAYLLGVEPADGDRDGKAHRISVKVTVPGADVHSRREFVMPAAEARPTTPDAVLVAAFRADRQERGLPIRLATHTLAAHASGGYRVLLSADIGDGNDGPIEMRILYVITDASGRAQPPVGQRPTLRRRATGPAGAVSYTSELALAPGPYTLRFAAVDAAGRAGSVDHAFTVGLTKGDGVRMSDLILIDSRRNQNDQIDVITDGQLLGAAVDAYIDVSPATQSARVTGVTFGVADRPDGELLVAAQVPVSRAEGAGHWSAGARLSLTQLAPGDYFAVAIALAGGSTLGRVARPVHVERAAVPAGGEEADTVFLPRIPFAAGESGSLVRAFARHDVLHKGTVEYFLGQLRSASPDAATGAPAASSAFLVEEKFDEALAALTRTDQKSLSTVFLKGMALLGKGELDSAAAQLRAALDVAPDFLPGAFYLGACYAAGGHDREAVGAWQAALVTEPDARIVYDVLGDALLRLQDGDEAARLLTEARDKWMDDDRFVPRLAASEALRRKPQEAMALLDGHVARNPSDTDALLLGLRLLYDARSAGVRISSAAEDVATARRYRDLYKTAGGENMALVDRWIEFISGSQRRYANERR